MTTLLRHFESSVIDFGIEFNLFDDDPFGSVYGALFERRARPSEEGEREAADTGTFETQGKRRADRRRTEGPETSLGPADQAGQRSDSTGGYELRWRDADRQRDPGTPGHQQDPRPSRPERDQAGTRAARTAEKAIGENGLRESENCSTLGEGARRYRHAPSPRVLGPGSGGLRCLIVGGDRPVTFIIVVVCPQRFVYGRRMAWMKKRKSLSLK